MDARVLLCDDNPAILKSLSGYFEDSGMQVLCAATGGEALELFREKSPDLIVLDVMLPDISGRRVCTEIRKTSNIPIIMLSAKAEETDRIVGLELGADDYVTKPFSPREVVIRAEKLLQRKSSAPESRMFSIGELSLDPDSYEVFLRGQKVALTVKEFEVLRYLIARQGKVVSRDHIINAVWGGEYISEPRLVDMLISRLRHKLFERESAEQLHFTIATVFGVGYKLEAV